MPGTKTQQFRSMDAAGLPGVAVLKYVSQFGIGGNCSEQQVVRRLILKFTRAGLSFNSTDSDRTESLTEAQHVQLFYACLDLCGIALHASTTGYDYSNMLLPAHTCQTPPISPMKILKAHDEIVKQYHLAHPKAQRDAIEYSEAAYWHEIAIETRGLESAFMHLSDTQIKTIEVVAVTYPPSNAYSESKTTLRLHSDAASDPRLDGHHTEEQVYVMYNETLLPEDVPYEKALSRWQQAMQSIERPNSNNVFPLGKTFWVEALDLWTALEGLHPTVQALRHAKELAKETGLHASTQRERVAKVDQLCSEVREFKRTLERLFLDAARRERRCIRDALHRIGWTTTTESIGLPPGGVCGSVVEIDAKKSRFLGVTTTPPNVCKRDPECFPWPPKRGAGSLKYALGTWKASRNNSGVWARAQGDYVYVQSDKRGSRSDDSSDDSYFPEPLDPKYRGQIKSYNRLCRVNLLLRTSLTVLPWYKRLSITPTTNSTARIILEEMKSPLGTVSAQVASSDLLLHILEHADDPEFMRICKSMRHLAAVHEHTRKICMKLAFRIQAVQAARVKHTMRYNTRDPLHTLFECTSEDTLHCILQHLESSDIVALMSTSHILAKENVLKQARPCILWIPSTEPWTPDPVRKAVVHRHGAVVGLPLSFGRIKGGGNLFNPLSHSRFFGLDNPPQISVELLFDSPSLAPVPHGANGPPVRYSAVSFHESDSMSLPFTTITAGSATSAMPGVKLLCLSSSYHGAFAIETSIEIEEIRAKQRNRSAGPREQARLQALLEMSRRNTTAQHFVLKCEVRCKSPRSGVNPVFQTLSPPFLITSRVRAKRAYPGANGPRAKHSL